MPAGARAAEPAVPSRPQPWPIRLTHWVTVPLLIILAGSGLQILVAFPAMGPRGELYPWYPFNGVPPPEWLRLGDWLAGARHWHFAFAWPLVATAALYLVYLAASGEWRRRLFLPRRDAGQALSTLAWYLRLRRSAPEQGLYNGLQRLAYSGALLLGAVEVLSGLAIYKPVQLRWLAAMFGGYDAARAVHMLGLVGLALFALVHITLVALHPRTLAAMLTGGRRPDRG